MNLNITCISIQISIGETKCNVPYKYNITPYTRDGLIFLSPLLQRCVFAIVRSVGKSIVGPLLHGNPNNGKLSKTNFDA